MFVLLFGVYVVTSLILFKFPTLLRERRKLKFECRHISHRGGAGEGFENTIATFQRGLEKGAEMLELDCQLTKDEQVVVLHDSNLFRVSGVDKDVSELNYAELPLLKTTIPIEFDPCNSYSGDESADRKIPLLSQVFQTFQKIPINIDVKKNSDILISKINNLIVQYNREDITVWGNVSDEVVRKCYKLNPNVNVFFSSRQVVYLILLFYSGLLPFFPLKETHLEIFLPSLFLKRSRSSRELQFSISPLFLRLMNILLIRKVLFSHLRKRGIQTYLWVLNDESDFREAFRLGASGVMTDYPSKLSAFLIDQENENIKCSRHKGDCTPPQITICIKVKIISVFFNRIALSYSISKYSYHIQDGEVELDKQLEDDFRATSLGMECKWPTWNMPKSTFQIRFFDVITGNEPSGIQLLEDTCSKSDVDSGIILVEKDASSFL